MLRCSSSSFLLPPATPSKGHSLITDFPTSRELGRPLPRHSSGERGDRCPLSSGGKTRALFATMPRTATGRQGLRAIATKHFSQRWRGSSMPQAVGWGREFPTARGHLDADTMHAEISPTVNDADSWLGLPSSPPTTFRPESSSSLLGQKRCWKTCRNGVRVSGDSHRRCEDCCALGREFWWAHLTSSAALSS